MKITPRYIIFFLEIIFFLISFLWFGRNQGMYQLFLIGGILTVTTTYIFILIKKDSKTNKFILTVILLIGILINRFSEEKFITWSFLIYTNKKELNEINQILERTTDNVIIYSNRISDENNQLTPLDREMLIVLKKKINVNIIAKTNNSIHYELWGLLDNRISIMYIIDEAKTDINRPLRKIKERWYY